MSAPMVVAVAISDPRMAPGPNVPMIAVYVERRADGSIWRLRDLPNEVWVRLRPPPRVPISQGK